MMRWTTQLAPGAVNDITAGDFLRVTRRTVTLAEDGNAYDVAFEVERCREVDPPPEDTATDRLHWLVETIVREQSA